MRTFAAWIGCLLLAGRALAGDTIPEGIWTGVQTLPDARSVERRAVFTFSAVENIGALDYRIGDGPQCRYVFRRGGEAELAPRPRALTAAEPECAERMTVSGDPAGGQLTIGLGGDRIAVRMVERFRAIRSDERQTGTVEPFDILVLTSGLTAGKAREILAAAGFDRRASRILSGPGWEEEHVTFARAPDGTGEDTIRIVFSPDIDGADAARGIVHVERIWNIAGARSVVDVRHSVTMRYGIRLERAGDLFVGGLHLDRTGARIGLKAWHADCAGAILQHIPFVTAFSDKARTEMISPGCGRALSVAARTSGAQRVQVASLHVSILDPQAIWSAAWAKWSAATAIDIREALDRMAKPPNPLEL